MAVAVRRGRRKGVDIASASRLTRDPVYFARKICGMEPTVQQGKLLQAMSVPGCKVSVRSGHGTGKTAGLAIGCLWFVGLHEDCRVPCTAPTAHQLNDVLWPELHKWHARMHPLWQRDLVITADSVYVRGAEQQQFAKARTARREQPDALQGFHATNVLFLIDEASGVDDRIFEVSEGALSTPGARVVMTGNPTRTEGYFFRSHHKDKRLWHTLHFSCLDSPLVSEEWAEGMKIRYGEESSIYRVRVLGEFPLVSSDILVPIAWVEAAVGREYHGGAESRVAGLDVARFGDDANALVVCRGKEIVHADEWRGMDLMQTTGKVVDAYRNGVFTRVQVDSIGYGAGVVDRLKEMRIPVVGVNVGETAAYRDKFHRLRDQLWWQVRELFESMEASISTEIDEGVRESLVGDLTTIRYGFTSSGKIKVEGKDEMKKRGLSSPNLGDALCLSQAEGLVMRRRRIVLDAAAVAGRAENAWRARTG